MALEAILTGLRIGAIVLWAWYGLRVALDSYTITAGGIEQREAGWRLYRPSELVMAAIVVFLFSPADILVANQIIDQTARHAMSAGGVVGLHVCAVLKHLALDVANNQSRRALPAYLAISVGTALYGTANAL